MVVKDVSSELDKERESERAWKKDVRDKKSCWLSRKIRYPWPKEKLRLTAVDTYFSPITLVVSLHTHTSVAAAIVPCRIFGPAI